MADPQEILSSPVNPTGEGEDPAVKAFLGTAYDNLPDYRQLPVIKEIFKLLNGGVITSEQEQSFNRMGEILKRRHENEQKFNDNQKLFLENVRDKADGMQLDLESKARLQARVGQQLGELYAEAKASRQSVKQRLDEEPKETVIWPGRFEIINGKPTVVPEVVAIETIRYAYPPSSAVQVPASVASRLRDLARGREEQEDRKKLLSADHMREDKVVAQGWEEINKKYGASGNPMTAVG